LAREPSAQTTGWLRLFLRNLTEPSHLGTLAPPGWLLVKRLSGVESIHLWMSEYHGAQESFDTEKAFDTGKAFRPFMRVAALVEARHPGTCHPASAADDPGPPRTEGTGRGSG
jgi:hypothetical protein